MPMNPRLLRPRQAGGFDPRSLPGLSVWLNAKDTSSVLNSVSPDVPATDGQTVRRWLDRSGQGLHGNQETAAWQPVYTIGQYLDFDGSNDSLSLNTGLARNKSFVGLFFVLRADVVTGATRHFLMIRNNSTAARLGINIDTTGTVTAGGRRLDADSFVGVTSSAISANTTYVISVLADYGSSRLRLRINGTVDGSTDSFHSGGNTSDTDSVEVTLGAFLGTPTTFFNGQISEFLLYNGSALSDAQAVVIDRYLGAKWGVSVA